MLRKIIIIVFMIIATVPVIAQKEKKQLRNGNKEYYKSGYEDAELAYRRALDESPSYKDAEFNLGNSLYKQNRLDDALQQFKDLSETELKRTDKSDSYYNLGNTLLKKKNPEESIEAYKKALKLNPRNMEAKYNLAYAQSLLQKQKQQNKENQQDNKEKNKENQQGKDDQQKNDQKNQEQKQNQKNQQDKQQESNKNQPQQMSREDAERLLQALADNEKEVQEKVKKAKAARMRVRTLKNW